MPKEKNPLDDCTLVWIWEHHPCLVSFFLSWTCSLTTSHTGQHLPIQQPRDRPGGAVFVWLCPLPSSKCFILFACWHLYSLLVKRWNENEEGGGTKADDKPEGSFYRPLLPPARWRATSCFTGSRVRVYRWSTVSAGSLSALTPTWWRCRCSSPTAPLPTPRTCT